MRNLYHGFTYLELMIALTLSLVLSTAIISLLQTTARSFVKLKETTEDIHRVLRLRGEINKILRGYDSHRLTIPPRIHYSGVITYTDGSRNSVADLGNGHAPDPESDAITGLRVDIGNAWRVKTQDPLGEGTIVHACSIFPPSPSPDETLRTVLGVSVDGVSELKVKSAVNLGTCTTFQLTLEKSMSTDLQTENVNFQIVLPIREHYTLYLDRSGTLRYLSHVGEENIENQPIIGGMKKIKIISQNEGAFTTLSTTLETDHVTKHSAASPHQFLLTLRNSLSRERPFNFLLNF